jgi:hypothetical protein
MRKCKACGSSKHMERVIDASLGLKDTRYFTCFQCVFKLPDDAGDLAYHDGRNHKAYDRVETNMVHTLSHDEE